MKICGMSDIHGNLYNAVPVCDVLCLCGDIVPLNEQRSMDASATWWTRRFAKWANELPCEKIILVPGNHDFYLENIYNDGAWTEAKEIMRELTNNKVEMLIDELYEYKGVTFYGSPWIQPIEFQKGRWAFEYPTDEVEENPFENIPTCDILITHDNPNYNNKLGYCCFGKYKHHLFGHWHDGTAYGHLNQYNCSILDDWYNHKKNLQITIIDVMSTEEKQQVEQDFLRRLIRDCNTYEFPKVYDNLRDEVFDFLKDYLEDIPILKEDEVEWDRNINSEFLYTEYDEEITEKETKEAA